jgi:hypothetical protein
MHLFCNILLRVADFEGLRDELAAQSFVRSISRELKLAMRTMQRGLEVRLHCLKIGGKYIEKCNDAQALWRKDILILYYVKNKFDLG